jgi:hypothetical protein
VEKFFYLEYSMSRLLWNYPTSVQELHYHQISQPVQILTIFVGQYHHPSSQQIMPQSISEQAAQDLSKHFLFAY